MFLTVKNKKLLVLGSQSHSIPVLFEGGMDKVSKTSHTFMFNIFPQCSSACTVASIFRNTIQHTFLKVLCFVVRGLWSRISCLKDPFHFAYYATFRTVFHLVNVVMGNALRKAVLPQLYYNVPNHTKNTCLTSQKIISHF